jgi:hypothetical protein
MAVAVLVVSTFVTSPAFAQQKCEGDPALCAQILQLQEALKEQKKASEVAAVGAEKEEKEADAKVDAVVDVKVAEEKAKDEKAKDERMAKIIAGAAAMAVLLKILISLMDVWKGYFNTDKQKAWLKISMVVVGVVVFVATNIGYGIPWWQAMILAGGGPASLAVHEVMRLIPVIRGKAKMPVSNPPPAIPPEEKPA